MSTRPKSIGLDATRSFRLQISDAVDCLGGDNVEFHREKHMSDRDLITKIDHIGVAVESLEDAIPLYRDVFGMPLRGKEVVQSEGVEIAFFEIGGVDIELLEAIESSSAIASFVERHGPGIHHIALECEDIQQARDIAASNGLRLLDDQPREGGNDKLISFVHPKDTGGVLFELTQRL